MSSLRALLPVHWPRWPLSLGRPPSWLDDQLPCGYIQKQGVGDIIGQSGNRSPTGPLIRSQLLHPYIGTGLQTEASTLHPLQGTPCAHL